MAQTLEELQSTMLLLQKENDTLKALVKESQNRLSETEGLLSTYENFISVDMFPEIESKVTLAKAVTEKFGDLNDLTVMADKLKSYEAMGTIDDLTSERDTLDTVVKSHDEYLRLGSAEQLKSSMEELEAYKALATVEELTASLESLKSLDEELSKFKELGSVEEIQAVKESLKTFEEAASLEEIEEAGKLLEEINTVIGISSVEEAKAKVETLAKYEAMGTIEEVEKTVEYFKQYVEIGTVEEVAQFKEASEALGKLGHSLESVADILAKAEEDAKNARLAQITDKFNIAKEVAESTLAMHNDDMDKTIAYLESLNLSKPASLVGKTVVVESTKEKEKRSWLKSNENRKTSLYKYFN